MNVTEKALWIIVFILIGMLVFAGMQMCGDIRNLERRVDALELD